MHLRESYRLYIITVIIDLAKFSKSYIHSLMQDCKKLSRYCSLPLSHPYNLFPKIKQGKSEGFDSCDRPSNLTQIGFKSSIFRLCDLEIWWMTPKNNKVCLLYKIKLCVSFHIHQWIQTGVTVRKRPIWVKLDDFLSCVTLQFDLWPWKTIGHLFYATSRFAHHFVAIGELKLEFQSENT